MRKCSMNFLCKVLAHKNYDTYYPNIIFSFLTKKSVNIELKQFLCYNYSYINKKAKEF